MEIAKKVEAVIGLDDNYEVELTDVQNVKRECKMKVFYTQEPKNIMSAYFVLKNTFLIYYVWRRGEHEDLQLWDHQEEQDWKVLCNFTKFLQFLKSIL